MFKTFDSKYKEKLVSTDHEEKEISYSEKIPKIDNTNQKAFYQTAIDNAEIATNLNIAIQMLQNLLYTYQIVDADLSYTKTFVNSTKSRCDIYITELQNILKIIKIS